MLKTIFKKKVFFSSFSDLFQTTFYLTFILQLRQFCEFSIKIWKKHFLNTILLEKYKKKKNRFICHSKIDWNFKYLHFTLRIQVHKRCNLLWNARGLTLILKIDTRKVLDCKRHRSILQPESKFQYSSNFLSKCNSRIANRPDNFAEKSDNKIIFKNQMGEFCRSIYREVYRK